MPSPASPPGGRTAQLDGRRKYDDPSTPRGFCSKYFSVKSCLLLALITMLLLVLPLVLPPLSPPPLVLLLVPVAMLAMLLLLALTPPGCRNGVVDPTSYL
ncbi:protein AUXIN-REGULATED GENE INVOLVED IN ORGAN SIZE-like [Phragmites australis]|uniref:protein AUXIN-REGULATED GENE INVOLVED IN ORGAN SIZE-like n=1 Tax=Phragmites australis TaxID=29695 RepID=UPI002D779D48|nr:protein AUXIN-REGULATED GENE INVOLVED IN ORGAN SIZE-like [Phragmites australis]XP_062219353.1 protein AUXIN-REGULATED GENE INVOLVED IN ORGAN SIZE-like [Phragmites australis]XP_062219354.1 protein AUXIN-REGULATED GENE INVOLVED IN ORGAN SIZE-like [Phragmites australis]XP_062219355.1 protein AUXIN-REGULATED GENE INVOLVED IN ORGAN SIZE-like [Phragmites australis]